MADRLACPQVFGAVKTFDLKEGGGSTAVTRANRREYVDLYVRWLLVDSVKGQYGPFERCSRQFFFFFLYDLLLACASSQYSCVMVLLVPRRWHHRGRADFLFFPWYAPLFDLDMCLQR